jgi:hypothetical protein
MEGKMGWLNTPKEGPAKAGIVLGGALLALFLFLECGSGGIILGSVVGVVVALILLEQ